MKTTITLTKIAAAVAFMGIAVSATAQAQTSTYTTPAAGAFNPSWYIAPSATVISPDSKFGTNDIGEGASIRLGKPLAATWDIQIGSSYSRARDTGANYRQNTFGVDALYMFSRSNFRPFILAGIGAQYDKANNGNRQTGHTSPYVNLGVGMQYSFNDQWGMQVDYRRMRSQLRGNDFAFDRANTNLLAVGATYAFDKPATSVMR